LLVYQLMDNMDGKQARRTGSSSPLGLLFDHGCDALNATVGALTIAATIQTGPTWKAAAMWAMTTIPFYFGTWEEFFTGELILPIINGPNEGILFGVATYWLTAIVGTSFWTQEIIPGFQNNTIYLICGLALAALTLSSNVINVLSFVRKNQSETKSSQMKEPAQPPTNSHSEITMWVAFTRLLPFVCLYSLASVWIIFSPQDIMKTHPRIVLWTIGLLFSKLVTHLMISHLCNEEYHPFRRTLIPFFFIAAHVGLSLHQNIIQSIPEDLILIEFFAVSLLSYCHLVYGVISEVMTILNIYCFRITPKPIEKKE